MTTIILPLTSKKLLYLFGLDNENPTLWVFSSSRSP
jgi:hypothetical protein